MDKWTRLNQAATSETVCVREKEQWAQVEINLFPNRAFAYYIPMPNRRLSSMQNYIRTFLYSNKIRIRSYRMALGECIQIIEKLYDSLEQKNEHFNSIQTENRDKYSNW